MTAQQRAALDALLEVPPGGRVSPLEEWRIAPVRASGPQMVKALHRVADIIGSDLSRVDIDASVTPRRQAELARWGMGADVAQLKRHGDQRRLATLAATAAHLEATAIDDALELLDLLVWTELIGAAKQEAAKEAVRAPEAVEGIGHLDGGGRGAAGGPQLGRGRRGPHLGGWAHWHTADRRCHSDYNRHSIRYRNLTCISTGVYESDTLSYSKNNSFRTDVLDAPAAESRGPRARRRPRLAGPRSDDG